MASLGRSFDAMSSSTPIRRRRPATYPQSPQTQPKSPPSFLLPGKSRRNDSIDVSEFSSPAHTISSDIHDILGASYSEEHLSPDNEIWDSSADLQLEGIPQLRAQPSRDTVRAAGGSSEYLRLAPIASDTSRSLIYDRHSTFSEGRAARLEGKLVPMKPSRLCIRENCDLVFVGAPVSVALDIFKRLAEAMIDQQWNKRNPGEWRLLWRDGPVLYAYDHSSLDFSALPTSSHSGDRVYLQWYMSDGSVAEGPAKGRSRIVVPVSAPLTSKTSLRRVRASQGSVRATFKRKHVEMFHPLVPRMFEEIPLDWLFFASTGPLQLLQPDLDGQSTTKKVSVTQTSSSTQIVVVSFVAIALIAIFCYAALSELQLLGPLRDQPRAAFAAHDLAATNSDLGSKFVGPTLAVAPLAVALLIPLPLWRVAGQKLRQVVARLQSVVQR